MLIPELRGGLGNMMWTLGSTYALAKKYNHEFALVNIPMPPAKHSSMDYRDNILKPFLKYLKPQIHTTYTCREEVYTRANDAVSARPNETILMDCYLQDYNFLRGYEDEVRGLFDLTSAKLEKYEERDNGYFLQVRRGDYLTVPMHNVDLQEYYKRSVAKFSANSNVIHVVSNDLTWCKEWGFLNDHRCVFVDENEVDTLAIMTTCALGGISSNSTYGWWGLFLNVKRPHLIIPDRFYNGGVCGHCNYVFPECTVVAV